MLISVKFAHRQDSPACLDTFDEHITLSEDYFNVSVKCIKSDGTFAYDLSLELFEKVDEEESFFEKQSAGRVYANLTKKTKPSRWRRLIKSEQKPPNSQLWWDVHEKYADSLLNHTTFETDEAFEQFVHIDNTPKRKKKPRSNKRKKKSAPKEDL